MKKCNNDCTPIFDFCINYKDYGNETNDEFQGIGICLKDDTEVLASDFCTTNFQGIDEQCPLGDINL